MKLQRAEHFELLQFHAMCLHFFVCRSTNSVISQTENVILNKESWFESFCCVKWHRNQIRYTTICHINKSSAVAWGWQQVCCTSKSWRWFPRQNHEKEAFETNQNKGSIWKFAKFASARRLYAFERNQITLRHRIYPYKWIIPSVELPLKWWWASEREERKLWLSTLY